LTLNETKLITESEKIKDYELYLSFLRSDEKEYVQNEDFRIFYMFRLIFEKSQKLIDNSLNCVQTDIYLQKIQKLQSDISILNEQFVGKIENNIQEYDKNNKYYYELLRNIVDNKPKLSRCLLNSDSDNAQLDCLQINEKEYKSANNSHILSIISRFEESERLLADKENILKVKKELFEEIKSVI